MILQYGNNNGWAYESAEEISYQFVSLIDAQAKEYYDRDEFKSMDEYSKRYRYIHSIVSGWDDGYNFFSDDRTLEDVNVVMVVISKVRDRKKIARLFNGIPVFILNDYGKTIQKIA
jgi:hypothetical protein